MLAHAGRRGYPCAAAMPDMTPPVEPPRGPGHDPIMESRVAVLEEVAKASKDALARLEAGHAALRADVVAELRAIRGEFQAELRALRADQRADYRWLLGITLGMGAGLLGALAKGFHWF